MSMRIIAKRMVLILAIGIPSFPVFAAGSEMAAGNIVKALKSGDTPHVAVVTLKIPKDGALLHVIGVDTDWNNKIILHRMRRTDNRIDYIQALDGRDYITLTETSIGGGKAYRLYLPYEKDPVTMTYSEEMSAQINPQALIKDYEAQERGAKEAKAGDAPDMQGAAK